MSVVKKLERIQSKAKNAALVALNKDGKALLHMATGTGKTETAIKVFQDMLDFGKRILWLTHQTDLIEQSAERIINKLNADVTLYNGSIKDNSGQIVVASIQTISKPNTLKKFNKNEFDLVVVDEAHHSAAKTWENTLAHFRSKKLGLTATPYRPDGRHKTIFEIFNEPCFALKFSQAQKMGLLAKDKSVVVLTNSVITGALDVNKDFTEKQLDKLYSSHDRNQIIIKSYLKYGRTVVKKAGMKPKAVCFCINTQHAKLMQELFNRKGIKAALISSDINVQKASERQEVMEAFRTSDEYEVICAVNIFNEGVDIPEANIAIMARPTRSNIIYSQQIGRLARANGGKKKFFSVIDFVDNTRKEYAAYMMGNMDPKRSYTPSQIITEFVENPDPVIVEERVHSIMQSVEEFEEKAHLELLKSKEQIIAEAKYFVKFAKHSRKVMCERN